MKFTVDRKTWFRGHGGLESFLLTPEGERCCIGFVGQQCGIPDKKLLTRKMIAADEDEPEQEIEEQWPGWLKDDVAASKAYNYNDSESYGDPEREAKLKALFAENGDEIVFEG